MADVSKILFMNEIIPLGRSRAKTTTQIHNAMEQNFNDIGVRRTTLRHLWELASSAYVDIVCDKIGQSYFWYKPNRKDGEA